MQAILIFGNTARWERRYPYAYGSSLKGDWICKVCGEYVITGDDYWKTKSRKHDRYSSEMFKKT